MCSCCPGSSMYYWLRVHKVENRVKNWSAWRKDAENKSSAGELRVHMCRKRRHSTRTFNTTVRVPPHSQGGCSRIAATGKPRPSTGQNTGSNSLLDKELFLNRPPYIPTLHLSASAKPPPSRCRGVAAVTAEHDMPRLLHCNLHVPLPLFLFLRERAPWVTGA